MRAYLFTVEGKLEFPLDMLRYDACWPYSSEDVVTIISALDAQARKEQHQTGKPFSIKISSYHEPTKERWASFGWKVIK